MSNSSTNKSLEQTVAAKNDTKNNHDSLFQAIFNTMPIGIGVVQNGILTHVNPMVTAITGYDARELLGKNSRILYPDQAEFDFVRQECERQRQRFGNCTVETRWQHSDGSIIDILYSSTRVDNKKTATGITFSARDITRKKETEKNLSSAYNELNQIFNAAVPICLISKECVITRVNKAFCDFFMVEEKDTLNAGCQKFWKCDKCKTDHCALHLLQSGQPSYHHYVDTVLHGRKLICSVHSVPHYDTLGSFIGTITTFFDMSAHKEAQDQLEKTREQLLHSEKLSAIGRLSASIAHEFNNPLYGIMNVLSGIQKRSPLSDEDRQLANLALKECNRIKFLISELQQFNRPSSGVKEYFDIHKAIDDILLFHNKEFKNRKMLVKKEYGPEVPQIRAVPDQIKQVLVNLFNNAGDAMPSEGGQVVITTRFDNNTISIIVKDNGNGILPENMGKIFEPFFTTKPAVKGTGLGLPVSFGIIKSHGGNITVESTPGQGATFTVILPAEIHY
ncbi:MAG: PAS domain S-box protein [Desulfobulbaceae bacterium]|uniref:histidine kinase n=1 Tax=Candidatus Desulfobia pelagia TaxID=2841692 RepID=A0A8J6TEB3_9BACT|nr:PAS domain S-box protein [Candidatus Desulfobia pelagia]